MYVGQVTVCFFVLCKRHRFNKVPGSHRGDVLCITPHLNSDAGYAVVPLTLLGAPVDLLLFITAGPM